MSDLTGSGFGAFAGTIGAAIDSAAQYYNQKRLNEQAQSDTQENMELAQKLNLESAFKGVAQSTAALRAAGLNPAMATGQTSVPGVSASAGNAGQAVKGDFGSMLLQGAQLGLLSAQREKLEAETDEIRSRVPRNVQDVKESESRVSKNAQDVKESESRVVLNDKQREKFEAEIQKIGTDQLYIAQGYKRMLDADSKTTQLIREMYQTRANNASSQAEKDYWQGLADNANELSVGTFYAIRDFASYVNDLDEYDRQMLSRALHKHILNMQISDDSVLYDLAHMPEKEFEKILAEIGDLAASRDFRIAAKDIGIPAEAAYKNQIVKTTRHNDFVGNIKDGNYSDAAWSQLPNLLGLVEHGLMLKYLKGGFPASLPSGKVPYSTMSKIDIEKALELSKNEIKALKTAKESAARNARLGELYRENKELMERLKTFRSATDYAR